jgi:hypothetical protein
LSPILGVCLIIWFSHKNEIITKILSTKLFVGIGLISYSLYLWHYPIFAVYRNLDFSVNSFDKIFLISLTLILSLISFKYVEHPARNNLNNSYTIFSLIIIIFILIALNFNVIMKEGYKGRVVFGLSEIAANLQGKKPKQLTDFDGRECHNSINGCRFNTFSNQKIYLIGDSHMNSLMFDLKERIGEKKQVITSTINSCIYFPGFDQINAKTRIREKKCNNSYFTKLKSDLLKDKDSIIIFAGRFPLYLSNSYFSNMEGGVEGGANDLPYVSVRKYDTINNSFKNEILKISKKSKIILIYPIPEVGWDPNIKIFTNRQYKFSKNINFEYVTTSYEVFKNRTKSSFELLDSIKNNNIYRVFPHTLFCNTKIKNRCITHDEKYIFYSDNNHPSLKGAELINNLIISEIKKINEK